MTSIKENNATSLKKYESDPLAAFDEHFPEIVNLFTQEDNEHNGCIRWSVSRIKEVLNYNVPHGKKTRGRTLLFAYISMAGKENLTEKGLNIAMSLGWAVEIMQAAFLVADDIMDQSETRRGKMCWYKNNNIGLQAINDSMILESCIFILIKACCRNMPYYTDIIELFHQVIYNTEMGQSLDMETSEQPTVDFTKFSLERYLAIVKYKTVFYSFYLPVAAAMIMVDLKDKKLHNDVLNILEKIGTLFQIQDDYLDAYGDPNVTGKVGTDVEDNKCSWLIIKAIEASNNKQRDILQNNYASKDPEKVLQVKKVYDELKLKEVFLEHEKQSYKEIMEQIARFHHDKIPQEIFTRLLDTIYQRKK